MSRGGKRLRLALGNWLGGSLGLFALLRLPSLFEPHWYTDEAGYANTAFLSTHGKVLYLTVWNNKPPLLFWIYDISLSLFGPSELGLHLLSMLAGALTLVAIWMIVRDNWGGRGLGVTMAAAAILLGLPLLSGDLALPENFLILPEAWAMYLLLRAVRCGSGPSRAILEVAAGVVFGLAALIQQTALGPLLAVGLLLAVAPRRGALASAARLLAGCGVILGAGLAPYLIWAGPSHVYFFLVSSFGGYTSRTLPLNAVNILPRVLAGVLLVAGLVTARHRDTRMAVIWLWLGADLLTYVLPDRAYPFHLLPSAVPLALALGQLSGRRILSLGRAWAVWPLLAGVLLSAGIWGALIATDQPQNNFYTGGRTVTYYPMVIGRGLGIVSQTAYVDYYSPRAAAEAAAARWIRAHGLRGARAVVWSSDSWAYLLVPLTSVMPAPPIYKDYEWLGQARLLRRLVRERPELILATYDALRAYGPLLPILHRSYVEVESSTHGSLWRRRAPPSRTVGIAALGVDPASWGDRAGLSAAKRFGAAV